MKYMIISDIHGSFKYTEAALKHFDLIKADMLLVLGDILYHGPRNSLPNGHDPKTAAAMLNRYADKIVAVRGNCDAEVDQVMLKFPCMESYTMLVDDGRRIFLTHGHVYDEDSLPFALPENSIYLSGHTHIRRLEKKNGLVLCNPGSISLPKTKTPNEKPIRSFAVYNSGELALFDLDNPQTPLEKLAL
ncbi:phosphoesterase [Spirochaetia bacterium]|nr:phosphoesterase [Spirochaetia bacterium]